MYLMFLFRAACRSVMDHGFRRMNVVTHPRLYSVGHATTPEMAFFPIPESESEQVSV